MRLQKIDSYNYRDLDSGVEYFLPYGPYDNFEQVEAVIEMDRQDKQARGIPYPVGGKLTVLPIVHLGGDQAPET